MAKICRLDPHVANLIAAGEVVERPASVVKELMENAIDAGAESVTLELTGGGMRLIRVTDNGCGIPADEAPTAFLRHATSKLRDARGLESIGTLGFRGEALAAIAAVSRVELLTRTADASEGLRLRLEAGKVTESYPAGCPVGTVITVQDLFYHTPARLKFMKSDRAEGMSCVQTAMHIALSHPEVSIRCLREGKEEFHTPGDGLPEACVYTLLGRETAAELIPAASDDGEIACQGFVCAPVGCMGNRSKQFFFVNGRFIRSKLLQAALEQAYRNRLLPGRYPVCALWLTLSTAAVDVNVHPAKTEVRFVREKQAFDAVYYATLSALESDRQPGKLSVPVKNAFVPRAPETAGAVPAEKNAPVPAAPANPPVPAPRPAESAPRPASPAPRDPRPELRTPVTDYRARPLPGENFKPLSAPPAPAITEEPSQLRFAMPEEPAQLRINLPDAAPAAAPARKTAAPAAAEEEVPFRVVGEAQNTYVIVEKGESLFLIDKHAAHERILFDALQASPRDDAPQLLLTPEIFRVGPEDTALVEENAALLEEYGFDLTPFGEEDVALRQIPSWLEKQGTKAAVLELIDALRKGGGPERLRDNVLHTCACRAAIKAGKASTPAELEVLAREVLSGRVRYCPHGRPVVMELTKTALDRGFRRI